MSGSLIELKKVGQVFRSGGEDVIALQDINMAIPEGSFSIIYGSSGSGKSTLLNVISGLRKPTSGEVRFRSEDLFEGDQDNWAARRARTLGMVYQMNYWVKSLTVLENVATPLYFLGEGKLRADKKALDSLARVGMESYAKKHPADLSGGEQQRVSMARALVNDPPLVVADEPTGNLDSANSDMVIGLLKKIQHESGRTVVLVTHELEFLPLGSHLFHIDDGRVSTVAGKDVKASADKLLGEMKLRIDRLARSNG